MMQESPFVTSMHRVGGRLEQNGFEPWRSIYDQLQSAPSSRITYDQELLILFNDSLVHSWAAETVSADAQRRNIDVNHPGRIAIVTGTKTFNYNAPHFSVTVAEGYGYYFTSEPDGSVSYKGRSRSGEGSLYFPITREMKIYRIPDLTLLVRHFATDRLSLCLRTEGALCFCPEVWKRSIVRPARG